MDEPSICWQSVTGGTHVAASEGARAYPYVFQTESAIGYLVRVIAASQGWYAKKANKIAGAKPAINVLMRKLVVDALFQQCVKRVAWERYNYKKLMHVGVYACDQPAGAGW